MFNFSDFSLSTHLSLIELSSLSLSLSLSLISTIFFDSFSLIQSLLLSHPSLCGSVPMHWCILDHMAWPWWCRDMADDRGVMDLFPLCLSLISLPFLFFSLSSFESSLCGSHGLMWQIGVVPWWWIGGWRLCC